MEFTPAVERWRAFVTELAAEFGKSLEWVDKVLWTMFYESGGDPNATGDGGAAVGLFQIHSNASISGRPSAEQLRDPYFNIRYAATSLGMANDNFKAWGENNLYNGQVFGALGHHPFPGSSGGTTPVARPEPKPPVWVNNAAWQGGGAYQDPQSGKYWYDDEGWVTTPRPAASAVPSPPTPEPINPPAVAPVPAPVPASPIRPSSARPPVVPAVLPVPQIPIQQPPITSGGVGLPTGPVNTVPELPVTPVGAGIPQSMLRAGQFNELQLSSGVNVNDLQGWTAWARLPNGNWQQWAAGEHIPAGSHVGLMPVGMSLPNGRNAR